MAGKVHFEVQLLEFAERGNPFIELSVAHVGDLGLHQISGTNDLLLWKKNYSVAIGVAASQEQQLHFFVAEIEDLLFRIRHVRRRWFNFLQFLPSLFSNSQLSLCAVL